MLDNAFALDHCQRDLSVCALPFLDDVHQDIRPQVEVQRGNAIHDPLHVGADLLSLGQGLRPLLLEKWGQFAQLLSDAG